MEEIKCRVLSVVYKNDDNGYTVFKAEENSREITVVGTVPYINEGQFLNIKGEWVVNPKFGRQLKISECKEIVPDTTKDIEKYLSSGLIYGIGPITAKKIVAKFREKTLEILDNDIEELKKVEGIGEKKLKLIMESYVGQRELKNVIMFYQSHGMSTSQCMKIYKKYGSSAIQVGRINPYMLCDEISGIGFKTSDKMAASLGIEKDSEFRISSGIRYVINDYCANGNTFMPKNELIDEASSMLGIPKEIVEKKLYDDTASNKIQLEEINGNECVFALPYYYCELGVTKRILTLAINNYNNLNIDVDYEIKMFEDKNKISFAPSQKEAITGAATNGIEIITGGPGTGKTTIIKCIIDIFEKCGMKVLLGAPTGRAAKRMSESTGKEARTIHRLLDATVNDEEEAVFDQGESAPLDCDAVIIDEASMIDIMLMNSLLKAIKVGTRLIIVGDVDQLPSVGPGNVLSDLINSNFTKVVRLKEIFRQGKESMIVVNAHRINEGNLPLLNEKGKDFFFLNRNSPDDMVNTIIDLINTRLPRYNKSWNKMKDIQILTPTRKGMLGVTGLNEKLQSVLNPPRKNVNERKIKDTVFRVGDKVMQTKNNYTIKWDRIAGYGEEQGTGVFNGDMGVIQEINEENKTITVIFDEERRVLYDNICAEELELAYAITIHKSQGSEVPVVIMPSFMGSPFLMTRNLLYTGITRAKMLVVLVGTVGALKYMVDNVRGSDRHSALEWRIKDIVSEDVFSKE